MKQSKLTLTFTIIDGYLTNSDSTVHVLILDEEKTTLLESSIKQSEVFERDILHLVNPIEKILETLKDTKQYDFRINGPIIEHVNIHLVGENIFIPSIWIDDLMKIAEKFSLQDYKIGTVTIGGGSKNLRKVGKILLIGKCENFAAYFLRLDRISIGNKLNSFNINDLSVDEINYEVFGKDNTSNGRFHFISSTIGKIDLSTNTLIKENNDFFKNIAFHNCILSNLFIRNINIGNTSINNDKDGLIFNDCMFQIDGLFQTSNSNIKYFEFIRTNNQKIELVNNSINKVFISQSNIDSISVIGGNIEGFYSLLTASLSNPLVPSISSFELKELYRQLKLAHDKIGNKTEANKFFAKEMEYYEKSLSWSDWDKKLISFIQRYSNNYGNSWLKPLFWIVVVSFLYTYLSDCWDFKCTCGGVQDWYCFQSHWLKNVSQFPTELKNAKDWWFLLYAIIMGSLFYQLLVALRRISQR